MKKNILYTGVLLLLIIITGCSVGKDYQRPQLNAPTAYYLASGDSIRRITDSVTYPSIPWRKFFQDSVLIGLIDTAMINNIDIKKALKNIEIAEQEYKQAGANFFPTLEARPGQYERIYRSENYYGGPSSKYYNDRTAPSSLFTSERHHAASFASSWEIDIWGKFRRQREANKAELMRTQEFKKAVQTTLVAEIARDYYRLLMLNAQLEVAKRNLELNDNTLNIVKLQYTSGDVSSLAIQQTEAQKLIAASLIPQIERDYVAVENRINLLLGRYPQRIDISRRLEDAELHTLYSIGVPFELLRNRPDVAASEYELMAANARTGVAHALRYPSLNIGAVIGLDAMNLDKMFSLPGAAFAEIAGGLTAPVFQNRRLKTNYKVALARQEIALLDFKQNMLQAVGEVSNAMVNMDKLDDEFRIAVNRIEVSRKGVKNASLLFKSGEANYLEIITAQSTALENELNLVSVRMQLLDADIELYRALGGGWD